MCIRDSHYGELLHLGYFKTEEEAIACRLLAEDRIAAGCHPKTGKYVPEAERPKPPKPFNNTHLLGAPAATFSDAALGEHATDFAAKVDAGTLDIDQVAGVQLNVKASGKWRARMSHKKKQCQLGSQTSDLAEAIRYRLLAEKAIALFPDKNPQDYVAARMAAAGAAAGAGKKKRKRSTAPVPPQQHPRRRNTAPPNKAPPASITGEDELRRLIAGKRKVVRALREALGRCATETEAHRREIARLRPQLGAAQREVAWLQVGDGQCARTRAYRHWQR